jgi:GH24 family phage-related lysozyme (muramidase)
MPTTASPALKAQLRVEEGVKTKAYRCSAGVWTIGIGCIGPDIVEGTEWTMEKVNAEFERRLTDMCAELDRKLKVALNQGQADALLLFGWNCGFGDCPTLFARLNASKFDQVPAALLMHVKARIMGKDGVRRLQVFAPLVARRHREAAAFMAATHDREAVLPQEVEPQSRVAYAVDRAGTSQSVAYIATGGGTLALSSWDQFCQALNAAAHEATGITANLTALHIDTSRVCIGVGALCLGLAFIRQLQPRGT